MIRSSVKRPITPNKIEADDSLLLGHWSDAVYEYFLSANSDGTLDVIIEGGSDNGEFPFFGYVPPTNRGFFKGDIILEIQGQKIAGYTQKDVIGLLKHCIRNDNSVKIKAVKSGELLRLLFMKIVMNLNLS